jgi:AcrR family transcriptional regulator
MDHPVLAPRRKRIRLMPELRAQKILDSALIEFSRHGFVATRIEDIAKGAGLTKSGFYAHFRSKEEAFEALLTHMLLSDEVVPFDEGDSVEEFIQQYVDKAFAYMFEPRRLTLLRLLLVEANRVPEVVAHWRSAIVTPVLQTQAEILRDAARRGQLAPSPALSDYSLLYAPLFFWAVSCSLPDEYGTLHVPHLEQRRNSYLQMLRSLLRAPEDSSPTDCATGGLDFLPQQGARIF